MSLTKATYSMIQGAPLNVLDFGADSTGITSSQTAFNNAIAQAVTTGQAIYAPAGTYLLNNIALNNGLSDGNGNKYGQTIYGDGVGKTIFKASGSANTLISLLGSPENYFYTQFNLSNFTIDMKNMSNADSTYGIYGIYAYGGNVCNVSVVNTPASAWSLYLDQGCYTTVWTNCDFGGLNGRIKLQGVGGQSVTTQTFIGSSWAYFYANNCSANSIISCIIQGTLTPKFALSEQYGLSIIGCDMEGTGLLYNFGANCNTIISLNNALVGFSGTYSSGSIASGQLLDDIYPVTSTGNPWKVKNIAITSSAVAAGYTDAEVINGTIREEVSYQGLTRKSLVNSSGSASIVDMAFANSGGSVYVGCTSNGFSYLQNGYGMIWQTGNGSPEGTVTGAVGSLFTRIDGGAGTTLYVKQSGSGNTGWVGK